LIDRELYLPESWTEDRARCRAAGIPDDVEFATKPVLAQAMLERAIESGLPFSWVTADEAYGQVKYLQAKNGAGPGPLPGPGLICLHHPVHPHPRLASRHEPLAIKGNRRPRPGYNELHFTRDRLLVYLILRHDHQPEHVWS